MRQSDVTVRGKIVDLVFAAMLLLLVGTGLAHLQGLAEECVLFLVVGIGYGAVAYCLWGGLQARGNRAPTEDSRPARRTREAEPVPYRAGVER